MIPRARRALLLGTLGAAVAVSGLGTLVAANAAPPVAADATPPSAVEDFEYPGAADVLAQKGLKLIRGDGHILLAECTSNAWNIKVETIKDNKPGAYCFKVTGKSGYLSLEVPRAFGIWNDDHNVQATLSSDGVTKTIAVRKDDVTPVGEGDLPSGGKQATLLELRVTG
ncbi:hypothetical protein DR950_01555 [Kitasatospora xanthocidica]|uniref:Secreted protein n=1 Tax=Kitasatospora xanthocidica TaxID=83382 RepID=A0A372ZM57_9ACTN|nr:hypothetical protein [Kitasatospora xanthocidica]RGD56654.1 hypothetical protein DR950_01555 [Kitasatospora xanthocidica]